MLTIHRLTALAALAAVLTSCAAKVPPADTFHPDAWTRVASLKPGVRVEVRYVSTVTGVARRHLVEGRLLRADADIMEVETSDGVQRLLAPRVLRVAVGGRRSRAVPLAVAGVLIGAALGGMLSAINESNDEDAAGTAAIGAAIGGVLGSSAGVRLGDRRPVVVYSRSGSL